MLTEQITNNKILIKSKTSYFLITIGIFLGLGSLYKIPAYIAQYGGSFLIAFIILFILVGFPLFLIQVNLGKRYLRSVIEMYQNINIKFAWLGIIKVGILTTIAICLLGVAGWSALGVIESLIPNYFQNNINSIIYIQNSAISVINWKVLLSIIVVFILCILILVLWIKRSISKVLPLLAFAVILILLTLSLLVIFMPNGTSIGLNYLFNSTSSNIQNIGVWRMALGQVLFMTGVGTGLFVTLNKYSIKNNDVNGFALITFAIQIIFILLFSFVIFSLLGSYYQLNANDMGFGKWIMQNKDTIFGMHLMFYQLPIILGSLATNMGYMANAFGILIYGGMLLSLIIAIVNILNGIIDNIKEQFPNIKFYLRVVIIFVMCGIILPILATNIGAAFVDSVEFWITQNFIILISIVESLIFAFVLKNLKLIKEYGDSRSAFSVQVIWESCVAIIIPLGNSIILIYALLHDTFQVVQFKGELYLMLIEIGVTMLAVILFVLFGYFASRVFPKKSFMIKMWTYLFIPITLVIIFFIVAFQASIKYNHYSELVQILAALFAFTFSIFIPMMFLELSTKFNLINKNHVDKIKTNIIKGEK